MPNIKSAEKRVKIAERQHSANITKRSKLKTFLKNALSSITAGKAEAKSDLIKAIKSIDEAAGKGIIHKNQAARRKSRLTKKLNAMSK
ncbi:MAG: 30S ribosomal protein S20 [Bacteroidota bacterium]